MSQFYRIRYSRKKFGQHHAADVLTLDVESELEQVCDHLPLEVHILYIEDLSHGQDAHWTRFSEVMGRGEHDAFKAVDAAAAWPWPPAAKQQRLRGDRRLQPGRGPNGERIDHARASG